MSGREGLDCAAVPQRQVDVVEAGQQAFLPERLDGEAHDPVAVLTVCAARSTVKGPSVAASAAISGSGSATGRTPFL